MVIRDLEQAAKTARRITRRVRDEETAVTAALKLAATPDDGLEFRANQDTPWFKNQLIGKHIADGSLLAKISK